MKNNNLKAFSCGSATIKNHSCRKPIKYNYKNIYLQKCNYKNP